MPEDPPPGWYADPSGPGRRRYWNGRGWTDHVAEDPAPWPSGAPTTPPQPGYAPGAYVWTGSPPPKGWRLGLPASGPGSLAPPVKRLAARMLDGLFFLPISAVLITAALLIAAPHFGPMFPVEPPCPPGVAPERCPTSNQFPGVLWLELTVLAAGLVASATYVVLEGAVTARWSRTPGKAVMHIRAVRVDDRQPLGFWMALARAGATAFAGMLQWVGMVDYLWCLWDENAQCVHDKVVGTIVLSDD